MSVVWSWYTGPLTYKDRCTLCQEPLHKEAVVDWASSRYHIGCLLNWLAQFQTPNYGGGGLVGAYADRVQAGNNNLNPWGQMGQGQVLGGRPPP